MIRVAFGTANALGLRTGRVSPPPRTAHLMNMGKCTFDCAYCTKAKSSTSPSDFMCRITWPSHDEEEVFSSLREHGESFERVCIQVVNNEGAFEKARSWVRRLKGLLSLPLSVELRTLSRRRVKGFLRLGVDKVGLPIDVCSAGLFPQIRGGSFESTLSFVREMARDFPGRVSTHLIVGLGETEKEVVDLLRDLLSLDIPIGLFAFTPCKGTRMENWPPPDRTRYRLIQLAMHLLSRDSEAEITYSRGEKIASLGIDQDDLHSLPRWVFNTSGCNGCNRPYYNERPSRCPYNFPETPAEGTFSSELANIEEALY